MVVWLCSQLEFKLVAPGYDLGRQGARLERSWGTRWSTPILPSSLWAVEIRTLQPPIRAPQSQGVESSR